MTNLEIENAYVGGSQVEKIYLGADEMWEPEYYVKEDNGTIHALLPNPYTPGPIAIFEMPHTGSLTLYHNENVVTAQSAVLNVLEYCGNTPRLRKQENLNNYVVQNLCGTCQYPTSTDKKTVLIGYSGNYGDNTLDITFSTYYCSGGTS